MRKMSGTARKKKTIFAAFAPYIDQIVETLIRFAGYYSPGQDPYDVWLSQNERGLTAKNAGCIF